jgi:hypothetical protein
MEGNRSKSKIDEGISVVVVPTILFIVPMLVYWAEMCSSLHA